MKQKNPNALKYLTFIRDSLIVCKPKVLKEIPLLKKNPRTVNLSLQELLIYNTTKTVIFVAFSNSALRMCLGLKYLLIQDFSPSAHEMNPNENVNPSVINVTSCKAIGNCNCRKSKKSLRKISAASRLKWKWIPRILNSILSMDKE